MIWSIEPSTESLAHEMTARAPPGRAVPAILIIVGALELVRIVQLIHELVRQDYYEVSLSRS
jgi:hypothetical protein